MFREHFFALPVFVPVPRLAPIPLRVCFDSTVCSNYESGDREMTASSHGEEVAKCSHHKREASRKKLNMHFLAFDRSVQPAKSNPQPVSVI